MAYDNKGGADNALQYFNNLKQERYNAMMKAGGSLDGMYQGGGEKKPTRKERKEESWKNAETQLKEAARLDYVGKKFGKEGVDTPSMSRRGYKYGKVK
jgi:hypothetical protein